MVMHVCVCVCRLLCIHWRADTDVEKRSGGSCQSQPRMFHWKCLPIDDLIEVIDMLYLARVCRELLFSVMQVCGAHMLLYFKGMNRRCNLVVNTSSMDLNKLVMSTTGWFQWVSLSMYIEELKGMNTLAECEGKVSLMGCWLSLTFCFNNNNSVTT